MSTNLIFEKEISTKMSNDWNNNEEIKIFCEYLRIASVQPDINYGK